MALLDRENIQFLPLIYVFAGPSVLVCDQEGARAEGDTVVLSKPPVLPREETARLFLEKQVAKDWFSEADYGYTALLLEDDAPVPPGFCWLRIRTYFSWGSLDVPKASRAMALFRWRETRRFCSLCGGVLRDTVDETARKCILCGKVFYPVIEPCIIVRVQKGDKILLAKHIQRNMDVYTCIAGFVEAGETLEQCVAREIRDEAAIEVHNIRYMASQSWPFPDQLMIAFSCDWLTGEPTPDGTEISDLRWFARDSLPAIPPKGSVAHRLIMGEM
jgi:NAD+ diphosphatase